MKTLIALLIFIIPFSTFAQNAYQDYTWGMTVSQVREKAQDLTQDTLIRWGTPSNVVLYVYGDELVSTIPNPLQYESGEITYYKSNQNDMDFYFSNGRLIAIELHFFQENIISELRRRYGNRPIISATYGRYRYGTAFWGDANNRRFIVYEIGTGTPLETVTYINANWLHPLVERAMEEYRRERAGSRSRLD